MISIILAVSGAICMLFCGGVSIYALYVNKKQLKEITYLQVRLDDYGSRIRHMQNTFDHYGIRMSNKIPDDNKYYKRWCINKQ